MEELNPLRRILHWMHCRYNVCSPTGPVKDMGIVLYTTDDFGNLVHVNRSRSAFSLEG